MPFTETIKPLHDGIMAMDDLVLLRTTVENWAKTASKAVYDFKREDGSFRKDSDSCRQNFKRSASHYYLCTSLHRSSLCRPSKGH